MSAKLVSLTVVGATQNNVTGGNNWAAVKKEAANVIVEATTTPKNNSDEWKQIQWSADAGEIVAGQPNRRRLSRAVSKKFHVEAALGEVSRHVDVWILWATIKIMTTGVRPPNAAPFDPGTRDNTDKLGAVTYLSLTSSVIDEADGGFVNNMGAAGKVAPVAILSPNGVHAVVNSGWAFERQMWVHSWLDSSQTRMDETWLRDTSKPLYLRLTPGPDDRIYDLDAPDIRWGTRSSETYNNFREFIEWNNEQCSDFALWHWQARWRVHKDPKKQITLKDLGEGNITLPSRQFFTILSGFDVKGASVPGGDSIEAKLAFYQKASAGGVLVTVTSDHPEDVSPPSSVKVSAGQDSATFAIATRPVDVDLNFMLTATVFGPADRKSGGGTVKAAQVSKLLLPKRTPAKKKGNIGTIVLTGRAGPHTQVKLNNPFPPIESYPGSVDVPFRATQVEFKYDTGDVPGDREGSIVASLNGSIVTAWTTVTKS